MIPGRKSREAGLPVDRRISTSKRDNFERRRSLIQILQAMFVPSILPMRLYI